MLDPGVPENGAQYQDLYRVLWFFERVDNSLKFNLVDSDVLFTTIGFHCWWWGNLSRHVRQPKAAASLHRLAKDAESWARSTGDLVGWPAVFDLDGVTATFRGARMRPGHLDDVVLEARSGGRQVGDGAPRTAAAGITSVRRDATTGPVPGDGTLPKGVGAVGLDVRMLRRPKAVRAFQRRGHQVYVWTVDHHEEVDRCLELGVDVIITNRPGHVLRQVARSG